MQTGSRRGVRGWVKLALLLWLPAWPVSGQGCKPQVLEGAVTRGESWTHRVSPNLVLKLEAVPAGWMVRIVPRDGPRPLHDAAELANPPYRSPTPILLSTDFAFRAQDAIAWNPRQFRFFTTAAEVQRAEAIYQKSLRKPNDAAVAQELAGLLATAAEGTLEIVDAEIAGGTANQTAAAATVALHLGKTAHAVRTDVTATPLGNVLRLRFRFRLPALRGRCRR